MKYDACEIHSIEEMRSASQCSSHSCELATHRHFNAHFDVSNFLSQAFGNCGQCKLTGWIHSVDWFGAWHACTNLMAEYTDKHQSTTFFWITYFYIALVGKIVLSKH